MTEGDRGQREGVLEALIQASSEALIAWSDEGRVIAWSRGASRLYGYSREAALGLSWGDLQAPFNGHPVPWPYSGASRPATLEITRLKASGGGVFVRAHLTPIAGSGGMAEVGRPLSRTLAFDRGGRESARRHLAAIIDSSDDAIVSKTLEGIVQSWNLAAERIFGYRADEIIGRSITTIIPPERYNEETEILTRIGAGERIAHYETIRMRKDGSRLPVSLSISPIYDAAGRVVGASKIARDIGPVQRAARALRDAQDRLRMVVDSAPVIVFALDAGGRLTLLEGRALKDLGFKREGLLGMSFLGIDRGPAAGFSECVMRALANEPCTASMAVGGRLLEFHWFPVYDDTGAVAGVSGLAVDIGERRARQDEALTASKWRALGVLAGGIAHDFNNMLAAIVGNLALARTRLAADPEGLAFLEESEKAALRARGLSQQLLGFVKEGRAHKRDLDMAALVESAVAFALGGANVRAHVLIARDLWRVHGDEGQLHQVINNIVLNAQQAMPAGGVLEVLGRNVTLHGHEGALRGGDYVQLDFVDQGCGIESEDLASIFEPFFTTKPNGSGLGLATSQRIIGDHGGGITIESRGGEGTRVRLYLPRHMPGREAAHSGLASAPVKGRILFMDDEEAIRKVARAMLTYLGYEVRLVEEGMAAVRAYQRARYDVVILDLTVRDGLGGLATLERLRALDPEVVAVVSSGYSGDPVMADHARYGFVAKIPKPYTPEALEAVLAPLVARAPRVTVAGGESRGGGL